MASKLKVNMGWNTLCLEQGISRSLLEFEDRCLCIRNQTSGMDIFIISLLFSGTSVHFN